MNAEAIEERIASSLLMLDLQEAAYDEAFAEFREAETLDDRVDALEQVIQAACRVSQLLGEMRLLGELAEEYGADITLDAGVLADVWEVIVRALMFTRWRAADDAHVAQVARASTRALAGKPSRRAPSA